MLSHEEKKICIFGDSHTSAIRRAIAKGDATRHNYSVTIAAAPRDGFEDIIIKDGKMIATSDKVTESIKRTSGKPSVELSKYDGFAICGLGVNVQRLFYIYNSHKPLWLCNGKAKHLISVDAFRFAVSDALKSTLAYRLTDSIQKESEENIFLIPQPSPIPSVRTLNSKKWPWILEDNYCHVIDWLFTIFNEEAKSTFGQIGVHYLAQPRETINEFGLTFERYHQKLERADCAHMNVDYGRIILSQLFDNFPAHSTSYQAI